MPRSPQTATWMIPERLIRLHLFRSFRNSRVSGTFFLLITHELARSHPSAHTRTWDWGAANRVRHLQRPIPKDRLARIKKRTVFSFYSSSLCFRSFTLNLSYNQKKKNPPINQLLMFFSPPQPEPGPCLRSPFSSSLRRLRH